MTNVGMRLSESVLEAQLVAGQTRITRSRAVPPVRFVHPRTGSHSAMAVSSALGGGMLEGDDYHLDLTCGTCARVLVAPQANTRIFPCPGGGTTRQSVRGTVCAQGLVVCGGDPVVPYAGCRFSQSQTWTLHQDARLVLIDWMVAGRIERGELFAFDLHESVLRVEDAGGRPLLADATSLDGAETTRRGMGGYTSWLTLNVIGPGWEGLQAPLDALLRSVDPEGRPTWMNGDVLGGIGVRESRGFSLRALGTGRASLDPLVATLFSALAAPEWLGFNFWARKY